LGLLFGFQRPSRLLWPRLFVTLDFSAAPHSTSGAAFFISKRFFCQAAVAASFQRFASFRINIAPRRFVSSFEGARNLLRFPLPCQPASSTLFFHRTDFFVRSGEAASTTTALGVNFAR
jgi:hypothetical protein